MQKIATMANNKIESHQITFDFQNEEKKTLFLICKMMMILWKKEERHTEQQKNPPDSLEHFHRN